jgi:lysophospholipase
MFRCAAATLCVFLAIPPALAIPEADHATRFERDVMPAYFQGQVQGYFSGVDDLPIHYVAFERDPSVAPGALVVVQGRGGSTIGDMELLYDLRQWGYAVYALDHRGQGQSGRMIEENHYKGHVERFQDYVDDLDTFLKRFVFPKGHHKVVVLATSMGGAVATIYAQQNPDTLDGLVLNVPMHLPYYAQFPEDAALAIGVWADLRDKDRQYAIGQDDPGEPEFYDNDGSQSRARFDAWVKLRGMFPEIDLGGPTYRWALESLKATRWSRAQAPRLVTPTFMLQAGKDRTVNNQGSTAVCNRAPNCTRKLYPNAAHGIFWETDATRDLALGDIRAFVDGLSPGGGCSNAPVGQASLLVLLVLASWRRRNHRA